MENLCEKVVKQLKNKNETISFMESCTGGFLANAITNIEGSSNVLKVSLVTYSNEYKMKFGVNEETINEYTVYSIETAIKMSKQSSEFAKSDWGIGITGEIGIKDINKVYFSIYNRNSKQNYKDIIIAEGKNREDKKRYIATEILEQLLEQIDES